MASMMDTKSDTTSTGGFEILFVAMGQGDCALIRCPDGKIVVVDCGSLKYLDRDGPWFAKAMLQLRAKRWAGTLNSVDALILTHADRDHYNKVEVLFSGVLDSPVVVDKQTYTKISPSIGIDTVYISQTGSESPLEFYGENGVNDYLRQHVATIAKITITKKERQVIRWLQSECFKTGHPEKLLGRTYDVCGGSTEVGDKKVDWGVSIIAGNVEPTLELKMKDEDGNDIKDAKAAPDKGINAASLVTRLFVGDSVALIVGDATFSTERFLLDYHANSIKNVSLVQVGHHGSSRTSSSLDYVNHVNPRRAIVSCGFMEYNYCLPRYKALLRWLEKVQKTVKHNVDYWCEADEAEVDEVKAGWKKYNLTPKSLGSHGGYVETADSGMYLAYTGSLLLYREYIAEDLRMTSMGSVQCTLP